MPTSTAEQTEINILKDKIAKEKINAYDKMKLLISINSTNPKGIENCGHKSLEAALLCTMKHTANTIEKMMMAHEKKWPD